MQSTTGPDQLWSWDSTFLESTLRGSDFKQEDTTSSTDQISLVFAGHSSANLALEDGCFDQNTN